MNIFKFSKKKIDDLDFVCAKIQGKLKNSELRALKTKLNDVVTEFKEDGSIHVQIKKDYGLYLPCAISSMRVFNVNDLILFTSYAPKVILQIDSSISSDIIRTNMVLNSPRSVQEK